VFAWHGQVHKGWHSESGWLVGSCKEFCTWQHHGQDFPERSLDGSNV